MDIESPYCYHVYCRLSFCIFHFNFLFHFKISFHPFNGIFFPCLYLCLCDLSIHLFFLFITSSCVLNFYEVKIYLFLLHEIVLLWALYFIYKEDLKSPLTSVLFIFSEEKFRVWLGLSLRRFLFAISQFFFIFCFVKNSVMESEEKRFETPGIKYISLASLVGISENQTLCIVTFVRFSSLL